MSTGISLYSQFDMLKRSSDMLQKAITEGTVSTGSGKKFNITAELGTQLRPYINLTAQYGVAQARDELLQSGITRMQLMSDAAGNVQTQLKTMLDNAAQGGFNPQATFLQSIAEIGNASFDGITGALSVQSGSRYLFSGDKVDTPPFTAVNTLKNNIKQAVADQAVADGGQVLNFDALYAKINSIFDDSIADQTQSFTAVSYRGGTGMPPPIRLSDTQTLDYDMHANDTVFRNLLKSAAMLAATSELRKTNSDSDAAGYVQKIYADLRSSADALTDKRAVWGAKQKYVEDQAVGLKSYTERMAQQIGTYEGADLYALSSQLSVYKTQLQALYSITAQMRSISLIDYLR